MTIYRACVEAMFDKLVEDYCYAEFPASSRELREKARNSVNWMFDTLGRIETARRLNVPYRQHSGTFPA